jgi:hypothetical protein
MLAARPQPPKPKATNASDQNITQVHSTGACLEFRAKTDLGSTSAPQRTVNALPMITTTAETVIPVERGMRHLCQILPLTYHPSFELRKRLPEM